MTNTCSLCHLCLGDVHEKIYARDGFVIVTDCDIHKIPMVVIKEHRDRPTTFEREHIKLVLNNIFGEGNWKFRGTGMRSIPEHFHEHLILVKE